MGLTGRHSVSCQAPGDLRKGFKAAQNELLDALLGTRLIGIESRYIELLLEDNSQKERRGLAHTDLFDAVTYMLSSPATALHATL